MQKNNFQLSFRGLPYMDWRLQKVCKLHICCAKKTQFAKLIKICWVHPFLFLCKLSVGYTIRRFSTSSFLYEPHLFPYLRILYCITQSLKEQCNEIFHLCFVLKKDFNPSEAVNPTLKHCYRIFFFQRHYRIWFRFREDNCLQSS